MASHKLNDKWVLWFHNPHDTNWSIDSYKNLHKIENISDYWLINNILTQKIIENSMLFIMRDNINPLWEDDHNKNGGCWSFKFPKNNILNIWNEFTMNLLGENFVSSEHNVINGISISPKKNFCIIKIWLSSKKNNINFLKKIKEINYDGSIFKAHN
jgi:translation initiation factor 4E